MSGPAEANSSQPYACGSRTFLCWSADTTKWQGTGLICGDSLTIYDLSSSILYAESKLTMPSSGFHSILHCWRRPSYLGITHNGPVYGSIWTNLHHVAPIFVTLSIQHCIKQSIAISVQDMLFRRLNRWRGADLQDESGLVVY